MRSKPSAKTGLRRQAEQRPRKRTSQRSQFNRPSTDTNPQRLGHELEVHQVERQQVEEALRASEEQFRSLFEHMFNAFILVEVLLGRDGNPVDHRLLQVNSAFERMTGLKRSEDLGRTSAELSFQWPPEVAQAYYKVALGGEPLHLERFNESLQRYYDIRVFSPRRGQVALIFLDITESRRTGEALRQSETKYRRLHQSMREAFASVGMDGHIQESNQAFVEMLGYTEEELRSMTYRDLTPAQWHEIQAEIVRTQVVTRGYSDLYEKEYRRKDGTIFPVELRTFLVRDDSGQPAAMWAIIRDISDRKRVEIELRESEERYRAVVEDQTEVISRFNTDGTLTFVNDVYCRFFGKARHELLGGTWRPRALAEDVPQVEQELRAMSPARPVVVIENRVYSGSGQVRWMQFVNRGFYDAQGRLLEIQGVGRDITERKRAVEALHELSGRLLRSQDEERRRIARELHDTTAQGLAALLMNLSLVKASAPGMSDKTWQLLAGAVALAEQCTRELRTVSYLLHPPMLDELGLAGAMRDYADGFARRSGLRIDLELPPNLEGLPRETALALFRVMQEALTNVHLHSGSRTASIRLGRTATELQLEVRDQGQGMEAARKLSAGDPPGGGLGVGVPGMRERMRQLGGRLEIESNERGTCVMAFAPVTGRAPAQLQP